MWNKRRKIFKTSFVKMNIFRKPNTNINTIQINVRSGQMGRGMFPSACHRRVVAFYAPSPKDVKR